MKEQKIDFEKILGRIFLSLISVIMIFGICEYVSRLLLPRKLSQIEWKFLPEYTKVPVPYVMFKAKPNTQYTRAGKEDGWTDYFNYRGYRGKEPSPQKKKNEFRIFLLGGSTVFLGNPPISTLLEEEFKKNKFNNVEVFNFGVVSSVSSQDLTRILFDVADLEPDLVITYSGGNDIFCPYRWDPRPGYPYNFIVYEKNPFLHFDLNNYPSWTLIAYSSHLFRQLFPQYFYNKFLALEELRNKVQYKSEIWQNAIAQIYLNNLVKSSKISKSFGAEYIGFIQPLLFFKDHMTPNEEKIINKDFEKICTSVYRKVTSQINNLNSKLDIKVVDLSNAFDNSKDEVFTDFIHIKQEMQPIIAKEVFDELIKNFGRDYFSKDS